MIKNIQTTPIIKITKWRVRTLGNCCKFCNSSKGMISYWLKDMSIIKIIYG